MISTCADDTCVMNMAFPPLRRDRIIARLRPGRFIFARYSVTGIVFEFWVRAACEQEVPSRHRNLQAPFPLLCLMFR
jgi:hypothetical protein